MSNLVHNERMKYTATFFNNTGVAAFVAGAIIPVFASPRPSEAVFLLYIGSGALLGLMFHFIALFAFLSKLKE
jgi:hypothetical protein